MTENSLYPDMFRERLQELYTRHHGLIRRACKRYVQNRDDADDLTVEVLIKAARGWETYAECEAPGAWLYRVAANHCADHLRRRNWRRDRLSLYARNLALSAEAEPEVPPGESPSGFAHALGLLQSALCAEERHLLHLLFGAGMNQETAARVTGVSRGTVARRMARIRATAAKLWCRSRPGGRDSPEFHRNAPV